MVISDIVGRGAVLFGLGEVSIQRTEPRSHKCRCALKPSTKNTMNHIVHVPPLTMNHIMHVPPLTKCRLRSFFERSNPENTPRGACYGIREMRLDG